MLKIYQNAHGIRHYKLNTATTSTWSIHYQQNTADSRNLTTAEKRTLQAIYPASLSYVTVFNNICFVLLTVLLLQYCDNK